MNRVKVRAAGRSVMINRYLFAQGSRILGVETSLHLASLN